MGPLKGICGVFAMLTAAPTLAQTSHLCGQMNDITSYSGGLLVKVDNAVPTVCTSSGTTWMLIPKGEDPMISTALSHWLAQRLAACVYVNPYSGSGYCVINQFDPRD